MADGERALSPATALANKLVVNKAAAAVVAAGQDFVAAPGAESNMLLAPQNTEGTESSQR
jgi:hypothetical protein